MGKDYGCQTPQDVNPVSNLSPGRSIRTPAEATEIMLTNGIVRRYWKAACIERCTCSLGEGSQKSARAIGHLAGFLSYRKQLKELLAADRPGDAVALFMMLVGMPADHVPGMRQHPMWPMFEAVAPTLAYDAAVLGEDASVPIYRPASIAVPALIMHASASYPFMHITETPLANAITNAELRTLQ